MLDIVQQREAERSLKLIKDINPVAYDVLYDALELYKKNMDSWKRIHEAIGQYGIANSNLMRDVADVVADIDEIVGKALRGEI